MLYSFPFTAQNNPKHNAPGFLVPGLRYALGIIGAAIIFMGLRLIIPGENSVFGSMDFLKPYYELGRFIRYGLLGLWASAGAPRIFQKTGLA